ncbi:MAG TPA: hypothetical protein PLU10_02735 [Chitinophagaceae bacterium]|nr:hypothetical protein [Chitinophagaceae bacterium]
MLRSIQLCILCLFSSSLFAQIDFKDIDGKWQEEYREEKKGKEIDFKDTLRIEIRTDGFMMIRHTIGATLTGEATIEGKEIRLQGTDYTIADYSRKKLVLKGDAWIHHFRKADEFSSSPVKKLIPDVEEGKKDISLSTLKGKWTIYKKTDPQFTHDKFYLKSIDFKEDKGNGTYLAAVAFNNSDSVYVTDAFVYIKGTDFIISSDDETFKAKVLKSDGNELLLENGSIHYFLKQFGKKE